MSLRFALYGLALLPAAVYSAPALDIDGLSPDVAACTDFDRHVNGKWQASAPMPADKGRIGSFDGLRDTSHHIVEDACRSRSPPSQLDTPPVNGCQRYYASGHGLASIESAVRRWAAVSQIDSLNDRAQLPGC